MSSLSINKAWDESVAFINREVRLVFPLALAFFMLPSVLLGWAQPPGTVQESGVGVFISLLLLLLVLVGQIAIVRLALGWGDSVADAISRSARRALPVIGASMLVFVPLLLIALLLLMIVLAASGVTNPAEMTSERLATMPSVALVILAFMLLLVAVAARLMPMSAVAAAEDVGPIGLINRSLALSKGHFWKLLGVFILVAIASMIIESATSLLGGTVMALLLGAPEPFNLSALIVALLSGFVSAAASAIAAILTARIYVQLAARPTVPDANR